MADDDKEDVQAPLTLKELGTFIRDQVSEALKSIGKVTDNVHEKAEQHTENKLDRSSDLADEVQSAIAKIRENEAKENAAKTVSDRIAALEERVPEKAPVKVRGIERILWGRKAE